MEEEAKHQLTPDNNQSPDDSQLMEHPTDINVNQPDGVIHQVVQSIVQEEFPSSQVGNSMADAQVLVAVDTSQGQDGQPSISGHHQEMDGQYMVVTRSATTEQVTLTSQGAVESMDPNQENVSIMVTDDNNKDGQETGELTGRTVTNDQEMGLAVAILELIGSQPHIVINPPPASESGPAASNGQQELVDISLKGKV